MSEKVVIIRKLINLLLKDIFNNHLARESVKSDIQNLK